MNMWRALLLIGILSVAQSPGAAQYSSCLDYGATRIAGTLVRQTYAGPPDYESVTKGDEPRVIWILQLDRHVCVESNARYPREAIEREIELALTKEQYAQYHPLLGRRVVASGELIHGGANYQKRLVIEVGDLQPTDALSESR